MLHFPCQTNYFPDTRLAWLIRTSIKKFLKVFLIIILKYLQKEVTLRWTTDAISGRVINAETWYRNIVILLAVVLPLRRQYAQFPDRRFHLPEQHVVDKCC